MSSGKVACKKYAGATSRQQKAQLSAGDIKSLTCSHISLQQLFHLLINKFPTPTMPRSPKLKSNCLAPISDYLREVECHPPLTLAAMQQRSVWDFCITRVIYKLLLIHDVEYRSISSTQRIKVQQKEILTCHMETQKRTQIKFRVVLNSIPVLFLLFSPGNLQFSCLGEPTQTPNPLPKITTQMLHIQNHSRKNFIVS